MKLLKTGNGHQHANHQAVMDWFMKEFPESVRLDNSTLELGGRKYHVSYSAEQSKLMLANTKHGRDPGLPSWATDVDGLLALRQLKDGRLVSYRFENVPELWDAKDQMVAISWTIAERYSEKPVVRRFEPDN